MRHGAIRRDSITMVSAAYNVVALNLGVYAIAPNRVK